MASEENRQLLLDVEEEVRELLRSMPKDRANFGIIHADMHTGNVLFDGDDVYLIDFDDTGWAFWLYDFAAALAYGVAKPDFPGIRDAFFSGYEEVRPLSPGTHELLGPFIQIRLLGIAHWVMDRLDNPRLRETGGEFIRFLCEGIRAANKGTGV
jgi:Ser/Thr protein kinase RdoA (MazF antagonist)